MFMSHYATEVCKCPYAAQEYLKDYIYQLEGYWWIFVVTVLLTGLIAFVSVIWQVMKAAKTNPAVELKKE